MNEEKAIDEFSDIVPDVAYSKNRIDDVVAQLITNFLQEKHKGKTNAITVDKLVHDLNIKDKSATKTRVRATIKTLIQEGALIASCSSGFYWIETREELVEYLQNLSARIKGIETRIENLHENWRNRDPRNV